MLDLSAGLWGLSGAGQWPVDRLGPLYGDLSYRNPDQNVYQSSAVQRRGELHRSKFAELFSVALLP